MLSGNRNATLGMLAGLAKPGLRLGLVWPDAHGDFNTPELDRSGFLDGQGLAMMVGLCWQAVTSAVSGFRPLPEQPVLLVGACSLDQAEEAALRRSAVTWLTSAQARDPSAVAAALTALAREADAVHFHVDLDVYDPSIAPVNSRAAADGLSAGDVLAIVGQTADHLPVVSAALASYDPTLDPARQLRRTAVDLAGRLPAAGPHAFVSSGRTSAGLDRRRRTAGYRQVPADDGARSGDTVRADPPRSPTRAPAWPREQRPASRAGRLVIGVLRHGR
jgi:arginase